MTTWECWLYLLKETWDIPLYLSTFNNLYWSRLPTCTHNPLIIYMYNFYGKLVSLWYIYFRNKSWKPECVWSFNMDWQIKFTNICQPMLKLKTHTGFHDLFLKYSMRHAGTKTKGCQLYIHAFSPIQFE